MSGRNKPEDYTEQEIDARVRAVLRGAFSGPPTPLKDIPKRNGESRAEKVKKAQRRKRQRKKRAA